MDPTKVIMQARVSVYRWHEFFPHGETLWIKENEQFYFIYWDFSWYHFLLCAAKNNIGVVIAVWAPIILVSPSCCHMSHHFVLKLYNSQFGAPLQVYFMDTQIWYAIFSTIVGGIYGAFRRLGEVGLLYVCVLSNPF